MMTVMQNPMEPLDNVPQCYKLVDNTQNDYSSQTPIAQEQESRFESNLKPTHSFKPQKGFCRSPAKSTAYIPGEKLSAERMKHLERNRIAANKCRMKKKQKHREIQSNLDAATKKRKDLLAEIVVLKENIWQLKNQALQHGARCDDQDIYQQLSRMTQNMNFNNIIRCSSPSLSVSKMSHGFLESEGKSEGSWSESDLGDSSESTEDLFDRFIDSRLFD